MSLLYANASFRYYSFLDCYQAKTGLKYTEKFLIAITPSIPSVKTCEYYRQIFLLPTKTDPSQVSSPDYADLSGSTYHKCFLPFPPSLLTPFRGVTCHCNINIHPTGPMASPLTGILQGNPDSSVVKKRSQEGRLLSCVLKATYDSFFVPPDPIPAEFIIALGFTARNYIPACPSLYSALSMYFRKQSL